MTCEKGNGGKYAYYFCGRGDPWKSNPIPDIPGELSSQRSPDNQVRYTHEPVSNSQNLVVPERNRLHRHGRKDLDRVHLVV